MLNFGLLKSRALAVRLPQDGLIAYYKGNWPGGTSTDKVGQTVPLRTSSVTPPELTPLTLGTGATYYVDSSVLDDSGAGTIDSPWKYIPGQQQSTHTNTVSYGDTIFVKKGSSWEEGITAINGLSVFTYGTGSAPMIDLSGALVSGEDCFYGNNVATYIVQGFKCMGSGQGRCLRFVGNSGAGGYLIRFFNCECNNDSDAGADNQHDGISTDGTAELYLKNCIVSNCYQQSGSSFHQAYTAHNNSKLFVEGGSATGNSIIAQNAATGKLYLYNVAISNTRNRVVDIAGSGAVSITLDSCNIECNVPNARLIHSSSNTNQNNTCIFHSCDINVIAPTGTAFLRGFTLSLWHNTITVNTSSGSSNWESFGNPQVIDSFNNTYNITNSSSTGLFESKVNNDNFNFVGDAITCKDDFIVMSNRQGNLLVSFCNLTNCKGTVLQFNSGYGGKAFVANNNIYSCTAQVVRNAMASSGSGHLTLTNNACHTVNDLLYGSNNALVSHNCYYNTNDEGGVGSITDDPMFTNPDQGNFVPQSGSPLLLAGTNPFSEGEDKFNSKGEKVWSSATKQLDYYIAKGINIGAHVEGVGKYYPVIISNALPYSEQLLAVDINNTLYTPDGTPNDLSSFTGNAGNHIFKGNGHFLIYNEEKSGEELDIILSLING